ncbi:MAG: GNAT family protein [Hyphomicrobiaceae bacterium]
MAFIRATLTPEITPTLPAGAVMLRAPRMSDYAAWAAMRGHSRDHLTPFEPEWQLDELSRAAFKERVRRYQREARNDDGHAFLIFEKASGDLAGGISLSNIRRGVAQMGTVGYWIGVTATRKGYATAALRAVTEYALRELHLHRIEAACMPTNAASLRTLERCGFRREGIAPRYLKINGAWQDHVLFALSVEDWIGETAA